jgi:hypothetical protein
MAVWFSIDLPMTPEQGDAVLRELGLTDRPAPGQLLHLESPTDGGIRVVDVWESAEVFGQFVQQRLMPAFQRVGIQVPEDMQPQWLPVRTILK